MTNLDDIDVLIVGASTRSAAFSALRAGLRPFCFDLYADEDLLQVAPVEKVDTLSNGLLTVLAAIPSKPLIYVGGMENQTELLKKIPDFHQLWGNSQETIEKLKQQSVIDEVVRLSRACRPETLYDQTPPAADGSWLLRPLYGTGGHGIVVWDAAAAQHPTLEVPHLFQRIVPGTSYSALFLASAEVGDVRFVGITQQLIGEENCCAAPFQWCGNIGPVSFEIGVEHVIRRVGNVLKWKGGLTGLYGIDFIVDEQSRVWLTDINPRYTGSTELLEFLTGNPLLANHCLVYDAETVIDSRWQFTETPQFVGKAIMYSPRDLEITNMNVADVDVNAFPQLADIPQPGTRLQAGEPICSVFASGQTMDECRHNLDHALSQLKIQLSLE